MTRAWWEAFLVGDGKEQAPGNAGYSSNEHYVLDLFSKSTFSTQMQLTMLRRERIHNCLLFEENFDNVSLYNNLNRHVDHN